MQQPVDFSDEHAVKLAFSWLTRSGIGRSMPMPIGWYQQHQCAALDVLYRESCRLLWPGLSLGDEPCPESRALFREEHGGIPAPRFKLEARRDTADRYWRWSRRIWVKALNGPNVGQWRELGSSGDFFDRADRLARKG